MVFTFSVSLSFISISDEQKLKNVALPWGTDLKWYQIYVGGWKPLTPKKTCKGHF